MTPKYVVYECENCGKLFYRGVAEVLADEAEHCAVNVELLNDAEGNVEEFPMCGCLGGDQGHTLNEDRAESPCETAEQSVLLGTSGCVAVRCEAVHTQWYYVCSRPGQLSTYWASK